MFKSVLVVVAENGPKVQDNKIAFLSIAPWAKVLCDSEHESTCTAFLPNASLVDRNGRTAVDNIGGEHVRSQDLPAKLREKHNRVDIVIVDSRFKDPVRAQVLEAACALHVPVILLSPGGRRATLKSENSFVLFSPEPDISSQAVAIARHFKNHAHLCDRPRLVVPLKHGDVSALVDEFIVDPQQNFSYRVQGAETLLIVHSNTPPTTSDTNTQLQHVAANVTVAHVITSAGSSRDWALHEDMRKCCQLTLSYFILLVAATIIASLGLMTGSETIVIGAMVIAPLMNPLLGGAYFICLRDREYIGLAATKFLLSVMCVVIVSLIIGLCPVVEHKLIAQTLIARCTYLFSPISLVAIGAALAAVVASCESRRASAVPGVAIAVALVPPLCTFGILLAYGRPTLATAAWKLAWVNVVAMLVTAVFAFYAIAVRALRTPDDRKTKWSPYSLVSAVMLFLLAFSVPVVLDHVFDEDLETIDLLLSEWPAYPRVKVEMPDGKDIEFTSMDQFEKETSEWQERNVETAKSDLQIRRVLFTDSPNTFARIHGLLSRYGTVDGVDIEPHQIAAFLEAENRSVKQVHIYKPGEHDLRTLSRSLGSQVTRIGVYEPMDMELTTLGDIDKLADVLAGSGVCAENGRLLLRKQFQVDLDMLQRSTYDFQNIGRISHPKGDETPILKIAIAPSSSTDNGFETAMDALGRMPFDSLEVNLEEGDAAPETCKDTIAGLFEAIGDCDKLRVLVLDWSSVSADCWPKNLPWSRLGSLDKMDLMVIRGSHKLSDGFVEVFDDLEDMQHLIVEQGVLTMAQQESVKDNAHRSGFHLTVRTY